MSYLRCPSKARALPARPLHSLVQWPGAQLIPTKVIWLVSLGVFAAEGDLWHRTLGHCWLSTVGVLKDLGGRVDREQDRAGASCSSGKGQGS